jgi:hypothetical protein
MDQVRVLRVVVASPGDIKAEREITPRSPGFARDRRFYCEKR